MSRINKRFVAVGASGIGEYTFIMEFISLVAIPINIAIVLFARSPSVVFGAEQVDIPINERPAIVQYLVNQDCGWNMEKIILSLVGIEHLVILLKTSLAAIIPDLPEEVAEDEFRRKKIEAMALEHLR